ncbi:flowering time control protein FCA-like isoform X1 [Camellia sinensis]|uniref:flowering time control protein FCA-like isoform X1 n=1 Tax=Camellia sinensis TaxID=4442 RepID=UPI0010359264|nr:flowering time control protein FCA-like isoform X1 [Camellia sinensis]
MFVIFVSAKGQPDDGQGQQCCPIFQGKPARGCGFVKYFHREMAMAAINALNGIYTMKGCDQPLIVRFADPKRPRAGDPRASPAFGGPGFGPRFPPPEDRPTPNLGEPMHGHKPSDSWHFMSPLNMGPFSNPGVQGFGSQFLPRSGDMAMPSTLGGPLGVHDGSADVVLSGRAVSSSTSQQSFDQSLPQVPSIGQQQISQLQRPLQSPQELQSYMQTQMPLQQHGQLQIPQSAGQTPFSHALLGLGGQLFVSQPQVQQNASSAQQTPMNTNLHPHHPSAAANEQQLPLQQSASQFAQMLSQQKQTLQASFHSSQQAFSELQQQFQLIQPSNQNLMSHQFSQATKQQVGVVLVLYFLNAEATLLQCNNGLC